MEGGGGREERFLHSAPPSFLFLLSFQFSRRTRAEPLDTQATREIGVICRNSVWFRKMKKG